MDKQLVRLSFYQIVNESRTCTRRKLRLRLWGETIFLLDLANLSFLNSFFHCVCWFYWQVNVRKNFNFGLEFENSNHIFSSVCKCVSMTVHVCDDMRVFDEIEYTNKPTKEKKVKKKSGREGRCNKYMYVDIWARYWKVNSVATAHCTCEHAKQHIVNLMCVLHNGHEMWYKSSMNTY